MLASYASNTEAVRMLLASNGVQVNATNIYGDTAIKLAAEHGHEAVVELLLGVPHIDLSIRSPRDGHNVLSIAMTKGNPEVISLLRRSLIMEGMQLVRNEAGDVTGR